MKFIFNVAVNEDLSFQFIGTKFWTDTFIDTDSLWAFEQEVFEFVQPSILGDFHDVVGTYDVYVELEVEYTYSPPPNSSLSITNKRKEILAVTKLT